MVKKYSPKVDPVPINPLVWKQENITSAQGSSGPSVPLVPAAIFFAGREVFRRVAPSALKNFSSIVRRATKKEVGSGKNLPVMKTKSLQFIKDQADKIPARPIYKAGQAGRTVKNPDPTLTLGNVQVQMPRTSGPGPGTAQRYRAGAKDAARKKVADIKKRYAKGGGIRKPKGF